MRNRKLNENKNKNMYLHSPFTLLMVFQKIHIAPLSVRNHDFLLLHLHDKKSAHFFRPKQNYLMLGKIIFDKFPYPTVSATACHKKFF
jgi:hypothetical protein